MVQNLNVILSWDYAVFRFMAFCAIFCRILSNVVKIRSLGPKFEWRLCARSFSPDLSRDQSVHSNSRYSGDLKSDHLKSGNI